MVSIILLAFALCAPGARAVEFAHGGGMCAAVDNIDVFIGLMGDSECNEDSIPPSYIIMRVLELAHLKTSASAYLTDPSKAVVVEFDPDPGFRVGPVAEIVDVDGAKVAVAMDGTMVGDAMPASAFGFVGTSSYLMTEGDEIMYNSNSFLYSTADKKQHVANDVCVVPLEDGACGAKRKAVPGTYKFSLYGYTDGAAYEGMIQENQFKYVRFRQRIETKEMAAGTKEDEGHPVSVSFNGGAFTAVDDMDMQATAITSLKIKGHTSLSMVFPQTYNVGVVDVMREPAVPVPRKTKTLQIHAVKETATSFFLDYIFEIADGLEKRYGYFVYDPEINDGSGDDDDASGVPFHCPTLVPFLSAIFWLAVSSLH